MSATTFYNSQPVDDYIRELSLREKEITRSRGIDNFKKEVPYKILLFLGYVVGICLLILCLKNLLIRYGVIYENPLMSRSVIAAPYEPQSISDDQGDQLIDVESILENSERNKDRPNSQSGSKSFMGDSDDPVERPIRNNASQGNGSGGGGSSNQVSDASVSGNGVPVERPIRNNASQGNGSGGGGSSNLTPDQSCDCPNDNQENQEQTPIPVLSEETDSNCEPALDPESIEVEKPRRGTIRNYVIFDTTQFDGEYISELIVGRRFENPNAEPNSSWCYSELIYASGLTKTLYLVQTKNGESKPTDITDEIADIFGVPISEIHRAQKTCSI